jgi:hypothetical protein
MGLRNRIRSYRGVRSGFLFFVLLAAALYGDVLLEEHCALFDGHINPEFSAQTNVLQLLRTKGVKVFVPNNWEGINGVEPIELNWKSDLPDRMK